MTLDAKGRDNQIGGLAQSEAPRAQGSELRATEIARSASSVGSTANSTNCGCFRYQDIRNSYFRPKIEGF